MELFLRGPSGSEEHPSYRFSPRIRRTSAGSSVWPGVQNLLLAARAEGLGAVLTTYSLTDYDAFAKVLDLPDDMAAFGLIPVGYPMGKFGPVTRLPIDQVTRFDRWS